MKAGGGNLFGQVISLISRGAFVRHMRQSGAERHGKGFSCWDQSVGMPSCHVAQAASLRGIACGPGTGEARLNPPGLGEPPVRPTPACANAQRPWHLFERVFCDEAGNRRDDPGRP